MEEAFLGNVQILKTLLKIFFILIGYFAIVPILGLMIKDRPKMRKACLFMLVFMTSWAPGKITVMLYSIAEYRGHTKGFEFSLIEILALALILGIAMGKTTRVHIVTPGFYIYLLYCFLSLLSIISAYNALYVLMGFFKFTKAILIIIGTFNAIQERSDIKLILYAFSLCLLSQLLVALKMRYWDHIFQVSAWFEHQNPLSMWAYFCGFPLLAVGLSPEIKPKESFLFIAAYFAAGCLIILSVSRASFAVFGIGSIMIITASLLTGITIKRVFATAFITIAAMCAILLAIDTILYRFKNTQDFSPDNDLRYILNEISKSMLRDHPTGIGWNNFCIANSRPILTYTKLLENWNEKRGFAIRPEQYFKNPSTESLYWLILAETGYPGFISYLFFMTITLWWTLKCFWYYRKSWIGFLLFGILLSLIATYAHSTIERVLTQTKNLSTWLMVVGLIARLEFWTRNKNPKNTPDSQKGSFTYVRHYRQFIDPV